LTVHLTLTWFNCFLLIVPLLAWNLVLGPRITEPRVTSDANSPGWLLAAENVTRVLVFALPLLFPLQLKDAQGKAGLIVYIVGTLLYFASWLPLLWSPGSVWSNNSVGLLAPRLTPFLSFLGIAIIGGSWLYGSISAAFITLHLLHGIHNLQAAPCRSLRGSGP
jgi:hypothetical protein